ncbi:hypothetical protein QQS21_005965 [Conoideocrella luteorostrata]|uniref:Uncharacterized protein n=1 Tax=Conoideocrella luteorostrata TaxID=1105319 RepID=A0AAJ0FTC2_9HYPO|nr:hypothetical protein QQS21_005965 [Conoideocrella luteorostrata]
MVSRWVSKACGKPVVASIVIIARLLGGGSWLDHQLDLDDGSELHLRSLGNQDTKSAGNDLEVINAKLSEVWGLDAGMKKQVKEGLSSHLRGFRVELFDENTPPAQALHDTVETFASDASG